MAIGMFSRYGISKAMQNAAVRSLAATESLVDVNAVCPGFIDTPMLAEGAGANQDVLDGVVNQLPIRRIAGPNEVADVIAWLFSSQSSYVTGVAMPIDGGWTAQ